MRDITIYRHEDGTAMGKVWSKPPTQEELDPEGAIYLTYTIMPNEFCEYVQRETKEKVHKLLDNFIWK